MQVHLFSKLEDGCGERWPQNNRARIAVQNGPFSFQMELKPSTAHSHLPCPSLLQLLLGHILVSPLRHSRVVGRCVPWLCWRHTYLKLIFYTGLPWRWLDSVRLGQEFSFGAAVQKSRKWKLAGLPEWRLLLCPINLYSDRCLTVQRKNTLVSVKLSSGYPRLSVSFLCAFPSSCQPSLIPFQRSFPCDWSSWGSSVAMSITSTWTSSSWIQILPRHLPVLPYPPR